MMEGQQNGDSSKDNNIQTIWCQTHHPIPPALYTCWVFTQYLDFRQLNKYVVTDLINVALVHISNY